MNELIIKKQKEIEATLKEAYKIQEEVEEISKLVLNIAENYKQTGDGFKKSSKDFGNYTTSIFKYYKKDNAEIIGQTVELGLDLLGNSINIFSKIYYSVKLGLMKKKFLPLKKQIAKEKKDNLERLYNNIIKNKNEIFYQTCKNEAKNIPNFNDLQNIEEVKKSFYLIFECYFIYRHLDSVCSYFLAEFYAWLKGKNESKKTLETADVIYENCIKELIGWSNFPNKNDFEYIENNISIGTILLLTEKNIFKHAKNCREVNELSYFIAKKRVNVFFCFNFSKYKNFNLFYKNILKQSKFIKKYIIILFSKRIIPIIFTFIGIIIGVFLFKKIVFIILSAFV